MTAVVRLLRPEIAPEPAEKEVSDRVLLVRALDGEPSAKEMLYRRHVSMVRGMAYRLLGGGEVNDLIQDVFTMAFEKLGTVRDPDAFAGWLGSIVVFQARKRIRKRRRHRLWLRREVSSIRPVAIEGSAPAEVRDELRALYSTLDSMPDDVRIALVLQRVEGLSLVEIAEHMRVR